MFSANFFNHSYFKKMQSYAFQLQRHEVLRSGILNISRSYPRVEKLEFFSLTPTQFLKNYRAGVTFFNTIQYFNSYNFVENVYCSLPLSFSFKYSL